MKNKTIIITIAVLAVVAITIGVIATLPGKSNTPVVDPAETTSGGDVNINIPTGSTDVDDITEPGDDPVVTPGTDETAAPDDNTVTAPIETDNGDGSDDGEPSVEDNQATEVSKADTNPPDISEDTVTAGQKDRDTVQTGPASGEDRNDALDEQKEQGKTENPLPDEDTEEHPVIVGEESSTIDSETKGDVVAGDEGSGNGDGDKNAPEYVDPATGGDNPFLGGGDNGVTEIPAEDLIGDGDPKPGEGIHF